jgi:hypothetical protein
MSLSLRWQPWKIWVSTALGLLIIADLGLAIFLWQGAGQGPEALQADRDRLAIQAKLLRADVERGDRIRASLPQAGKQCDNFYQQSFLDAGTGYSKIESDFGSIASQSGVKTTDLTFKRVEVANRGATEIAITADVEGDYPALVRFINSLETSKNFYLLDSLRLNYAKEAGVKLSLDLHTYFRT